MLAKRPHNILKTLDKMGREENYLSSWMDDLFHFHGFSPFKGIDNPNFSPSIDFVEKADKYIMNAEVPGIEKNGLEINIDDGIIAIKGEKKSEKKEENDETYVCERSYGIFRREIRLPNDCDKENIIAEYKDGVLSLTIPKIKEKEKEIKKISIQ